MQKRNVHMLIEQVWHLGDLSPRLFLQKSTIMFFFGMIFFLKEIAFFFFFGNITFLVCFSSSYRLIPVYCTIFSILRKP